MSCRPDWSAGCSVDSGTPPGSDPCKETRKLFQCFWNRSHNDLSALVREHPNRSRMRAPALHQPNPPPFSSSLYKSGNCGDCVRPWLQTFSKPWFRKLRELNTSHTATPPPLRKWHPCTEHGYSIAFLIRVRFIFHKGATLRLICAETLNYSSTFFDWSSEKKWHNWPTSLRKTETHW